MKISSILIIANLVFQTGCAQTGSGEPQKKVTGVSMAIKAEKFIIPNGDTVTIEKLDSVTASWNHASLMFHPDSSDPEIMHVRPRDSVYFKKLAEDQQQLKSLLNSRAPGFTLKDLTGKSVSLADFYGKVVVLNFWFTTCGACIIEMPELNKIKTRYDPSEVIFLALARDDTKTVRGFLKHHQFKYTLLPNATQAITYYKIFSYPTSIVIGRTGMIDFIQQSLTDVSSSLTVAINRAISTKFIKL